LSRLYATKQDVESALKRLAVLHKNWGFKLVPKYHVLPTLYGVGGNYNDHTGFVFVKISPEGNFPNNCPSGAIIALHEIVHIGIEEDIVKKFNLNCFEKEYLVDSICSMYLKDILPEYKFQKDLMKEINPDDTEWEMGSKDIAGYINEEAIVHNLPLAVSKYVTAHPR
jgi:hypothetical protein